MRVKFDIEDKFNSTAVPNFFIENYMLKGNAFYCVVFIYIYKKYCCREKDIDLDDIKKKFNISEIEVINCLDYWQEEKIIEYRIDDVSLYIKFIFDDIEKKDIASDILNENGFRGKYDKFRDLFDFAQEILGRYLTHGDIDILFNLHDDLKLPLDVIKFLINYCVNNGKRNISYIEKVGIAWANDEIFTLEAAEEKLNFFCDIKRALAVNKINSEQRKKILSWHEKLGFEKELIIKACNITMLKIGTPNLNYVEKIINNWYENDIKKLEDVEKFISENKNKINKEEKRFSFKGVKKRNIAEFERKKWNFSEIRQIIDNTGKKALEGDSE